LSEEAKMDEWLFISLAKTKADAPSVNRKVDAEPQNQVLTKAQTVEALDLAVVEEKAAFRGAAAFVGAVLVNAVLLTAIDDGALDARTPKGEVIVAQLDPLDPLDPLSIDGRSSTYEAAVTYVQ
jgi:hypothetical protein